MKAKMDYRKLSSCGRMFTSGYACECGEVDSMNTDMSVGFGTDTQTPNPSPVLPNTASLRSVPSALSFGDNNSLSSNAQTFSLQGHGTTTRYVVVKDTRAVITHGKLQKSFGIN